MQCRDCGAHVTEEDLFCGECGRPLASPATPVEPLSPEEAKDLPTIGLEPPARPPSAAPPARPAKKSSALLPVLILAGIGLVLLCLFVGGLFAWLGAREESTKGRLGELLYEETFDDPASGWDTYSEDDTWAGYVDGEYRLEVYRDNYVTWGNPEPGLDLDGFVIEVDARQVEGPLDNNFGLLVRYQADDENYYWFEISSDGYYSVDLMQAGEWITLVGWQTSEAINQGGGATNHLQVISDGSQFSFYANGTHLTDVTDNALDVGNVGLAAGSFDEPGVVVHFDNVKVYALQE